MRRDRTNLRQPARVLRRKLVKDTRAVEKVAFRRNFAVEPQRQRRLNARKLLRSDRKTIPRPAIMRENAQLVDRADVRRNRRRVDLRLNARDRPFVPAFELADDPLQSAVLVKLVIPFLKLG